MSVLLSLFGVGLVIFALVTIHFGNKKTDEKERSLDAYEGTLLELKKNIEDMELLKLNQLLASQVNVRKSPFILLRKTSIQ